jgi:hypothetical protein
MDNYEKQVQDFLTKTGTKLTITFDAFKKHFPEDEQPRNVYNVKLERNGQTYTCKFGDSINNTESGKKPTPYAVMSCLASDSAFQCADVGEMMDEFGYSAETGAEMRKLESLFKRCKKAAEQLQELFADCLDDLWAIQ